MKQFLEQHPQVKRWCYILGGVVLYAQALNLFLIGNNIAAGGISGIAIVINAFYDVEVGVLLMMMNIPILLVALCVNGWKYTGETLIAASLYSVVVDLGANIPTVTTNPLVAAVFGGALYGWGMASLAFGVGSTGGTDLIIRLLIKKFPKASLGKIALVVDGSIILFAVFAFKDIEVGLYAIITIAVSSFVADRIVLGLDRGCLCMIVTAKDPQIVSDYLMSGTLRAVTKVEAQGMYAGTQRSILYIAVKPQEVPAVKLLLSQVDEQAFVMVLPATEVLGGTFHTRPLPKETE